MSPRAPRFGSATPKETAMRRAVSARDAGLRRISAVTRWLVVAVVGLSGALALIASQAFHGRTVSNASAAASSPAVQAPAASSDGFSQANVAPTPTPAAPVVVSGGS
ncbi:MAG: hypothetical protein ABSF58_09700 [Solirubrobacteraceae bacterium]|jgi:hypothetical protein